MTDAPAPIPLWPAGAAPEGAFRPYLEPWPLAAPDRPRGAVLVLPGGGYGGRADHEAAPVAQRFRQAGLHAFVVHYRVAPHRHPAPLRDAARAVRIVRGRASEWGVDPSRIAVCGFSAGGHLAASLGVHFETAGSQTADDLDALSARPDALVLGYPVITAGQHTHGGSLRNLLGENPSPEALRLASVELHVTRSTPPAFLWHTADDPGVPVENSLAFASALRGAGVPFELHVYPSGPHGLGLAPAHPHVATWAELCCEWLAGMGW